MYEYVTILYQNKMFNLDHFIDFFYFCNFSSELSIEHISDHIKVTDMYPVAMENDFDQVQFKYFQNN